MKMYNIHCIRMYTPQVSTSVLYVPPLKIMPKYDLFYAVIIQTIYSTIRSEPIKPILCRMNQTYSFDLIPRMSKYHATNDRYRPTYGLNSNGILNEVFSNMQICV